MIVPLAITIAAVSQGVPAEDPRITAALAALPPQIAGMPRAPDKQGLAVYRSATGDATIAVSLSGYEKPLDDEIARGMGIAIVSRPSAEGWFETGSKPGAKGYFGETVTENGATQVWVLQRDGTLIIVKAIIHRADDRPRIREGTMRALFDGASILSAK